MTFLGRRLDEKRCAAVVRIESRVSYLRRVTTGNLASRNACKNHASEPEMTSSDARPDP